mmetsp:Transcript_75890/g.240087  ORF Transcript_75890/g.240087 Transcript_75890/m.240087 type:complete len:221 (+) Transcript_75890:239-901(+)
MRKQAGGGAGGAGAGAAQARPGCGPPAAAELRQRRACRAGGRAAGLPRLGGLRAPGLARGGGLRGGEVLVECHAGRHLGGLHAAAGGLAAAPRGAGHRRRPERGVAAQHGGSSARPAPLRAALRRSRCRRANWCRFGAESHAGTGYGPGGRPPGGARPHDARGRRGMCGASEPRGRRRGAARPTPGCARAVRALEPPLRARGPPGGSAGAHRRPQGGRRP